MPIHCTSSGKLLLAHMPARQRRRVLYGAPIKRYTGKTITDPARLEAELARIRKTKISTDDEGYLAGLISVAVPVLGRNRRMIATVAVHAPTARMSLKRGAWACGVVEARCERSWQNLPALQIAVFSQDSESRLRCSRIVKIFGPALRATLAVA